MEVEERWQEFKTRIEDLSARLNDAPAEVRTRKEWKSADAFVEDAREALDKVQGLEKNGADKEGDAEEKNNADNVHAAKEQAEDLERYLSLHEDAFALLLVERERQLEGKKRERQLKWANERHRIDAVQARFLPLKVMMLLSWICALGLGLSFETLGLLAIAPAGIGCLEVLRHKKSADVNTFVIERQSAAALQEKLGNWLGGFIAAVLVGIAITVIKSFIFVA